MVVNIDKSVAAAHNLVDSGLVNRAYAQLTKSEDRTSADYWLCVCRVFFHLGDWEGAWRARESLRKADGYDPSVHDGDFERYHAFHSVLWGPKSGIPQALEALEEPGLHASNPNRAGLDTYVRALGARRLGQVDQANELAWKAFRCFHVNPDGVYHPRYNDVLWLAFKAAVAARDERASTLALTIHLRQEMSPRRRALTRLYVNWPAMARLLMPAVASFTR